MAKHRISESVGREVLGAYNYYCSCRDCCTPAIEIHHIKSNSIANNNRWPLFMQSPFNLKPICRACHDSEAIYQFKITDKVADMYENYLTEIRG